MISYLRMENFRRHASTELRFDGGGQIVLIAGPNGAGKSSIIEAIVFALYGEGRNGNRWLDRLVRRGGELEGMEVEIEFDVDGVSYRIKRRRDNKMSSAVIWGNDVSLTEGSREVTLEVTRVLGMDARGFRLAVVAQQKELDGLTSMRPAERGSMLSRLLRLDAITNAKDAARGKFRSEREALRGLGIVEGIDGIDLEIKELTKSIEAGEAAERETEVALGTLDAELAAGAGVEAAYLAASANVARMSGLVASAVAEKERIANELSRIEVVEVDVSGIDLDALSARSGELTRLVAEGEAAKTMASQAGVVKRELEETERRLCEIDGELLGANLDEVETQALVGRAQEAVTAARAELTRVGEERAQILALAGEAEAALERAKSLGATCDECGQSVSDEHRHTQQERALWRQQELLGRLVHTDVKDVRARLGLAEEALGKCREDLEAVRRANRLATERSELVRRQETYRHQLERLSGDPVDLESLYSERGVVESDLALARAKLDQAKIAEMMKERRASVEANWRAVVVRCEEAESWAEQSRIDTDLEAAHDRMAALAAGRAAEYEVLAGLRADLATKRERVTGQKRERERVAATEARRRGMERAGMVASLTAEVLERVATNLNQQIRPQLEGGISEVLSRMSDGRFNAVHLDEDYTLSVRDDGQLRSLSEFSGGEIDLIALSVRLALAEVVSERHGAGGVGFLILDECFGSQDQDRRGSIMTALRGLRGSYGQILLISHVGGLEDAADVVVEVGIDEVSGLAVAVMGD